MKIILTTIYLLLTTSGIVLMKLGDNSLSLMFKNGIDFKIGYFTLLGFLLYFFSFLLWQKLLVIFDLSYIVPITTGISQIIILIIGYWLFKENISIYNVLGIILIIFGIILITLNK